MEPDSTPINKPELTNRTAVVIDKDLATWQQLNVVAFLASAIASNFPETMGKEFKDSSNKNYLSIFRVPVLVFEGTGEQVRRAYERARARGLAVGIYTRDIFKTQGDDNWTAIAAKTEAEQDLVGTVMYGARSPVSKAVDGLELHK